MIPFLAAMLDVRRCVSVTLSSFRYILPSHFEINMYVYQVLMLNFISIDIACFRSSEIWKIHPFFSVLWFEFFISIYQTQLLGRIFKFWYFSLKNRWCWNVLKVGNCIDYVLKIVKYSLYISFLSLFLLLTDFTTWNKAHWFLICKRI